MRTERTDVLTARRRHGITLNETADQPRGSAAQTTETFRIQHGSSSQAPLVVRAPVYLVTGPSRWTSVLSLGNTAERLFATARFLHQIQGDPACQGDHRRYVQRNALTGNGG